MSEQPSIADKQRNKLAEIDFALGQSDIWVVRAQEEGQVISKERMQYRQTLRNLRAQAETSQTPESIVLPPEPPYAVAPVERHYFGTTGEPPFLNGWSDVGAPFARANYRRNVNVIRLEGQVTIAGDMKNNVNSPIAQLPAGARPIAELRFSSLVNGESYALMVVGADGMITWRGFTIVGKSGTTLVSGVSLNEIGFSTA